MGIVIKTRLNTLAVGFVFTGNNLTLTFSRSNHETRSAYIFSFRYMCVWHGTKIILFFFRFRNHDNVQVSTRPHSNTELLLFNSLRAALLGSRRPSPSSSFSSSWRTRMTGVYTAVGYRSVRSAQDNYKISIFTNKLLATMACWPPQPRRHQMDGDDDGPMNIHEMGAHTRSLFFGGE